jgi:phage shock protein C
MKRLTRSNDKLVAGIISGFSNYVNPELDPVFFRLAFAVIVFYNPAVLLIYFGLAIILPVETVSYSK